MRQTTRMKKKSFDYSSSSPQPKVTKAEEKSGSASTAKHARKSSLAPLPGCVAFTFKSYAVGSQTYVAGDFNNWEGQKMNSVSTKERGKHQELRLKNLKPLTKYEYCFLVDGKWTTNKHESIGHNLSKITGLQNNYLVTKSAEVEAESNVHDLTREKSFISINRKDVIDEENESSSDHEPANLTLNTFVPEDQADVRVTVNLINIDEAEQEEENEGEDASWLTSMQQAAESLFENLFEPEFEQAVNEGQVYENRVFITQHQFKEAINNLNQNDDQEFLDQADHFLLLGQNATHPITGFIYKDRLFKVILEDMKIQMAGEEEAQNMVEDLNIPLGISPSKRNKRNNLLRIDKLSSVTEQKSKIYSYGKLLVDSARNSKRHSRQNSIQNDNNEMSQVLTSNRKSKAARKQILYTPEKMDMFQSSKLANHTGESANITVLANASHVRNQKETLEQQIEQNKSRVTQFIENQQNEAPLPPSPKVAKKVEFVFNQIFSTFMEFFGPRGEKSIIYLEAFVEAINNSGNDSDHSNSIVLRAMFERADSDKQGYISKEQLLQLIQEDIQNGQKENKSFDSIYNTIDSENFGLSSFKQAPKVDPALQALTQLAIAKKDGSIVQLCQNLSSALEYISSNKIDEYKNKESTLREVFENLAKITDNLSVLVEKKQEEDANKNEQQLQNHEMEAQIDQLECELEKMKTYESNYYQVEKKLDMAVKKNDEMEIERENLQFVNNDMVMELSKVQHDMNLLDMQHKKVKLKSQENQQHIQNLKAKLIQKYERNSVLSAVQVEEEELEFREQNRSAENLNFFKNDNHSSQSLSSSMEKQWQFEENSSNSDTHVPRNSIKKQNVFSNQRENENEFKDDFVQKIETKILEEMETTQLFKMKGRIRDYIVDHVQLERQGLMNKIKTQEKQIMKQNQKRAEIKMQRDEFHASLNSALQIGQEWQNKYDSLVITNDNQKRQLIEQLEENQRVIDEKRRMAEVNRLLEQNIQMEKSDKMMFMSEVSHIDRMLGKASQSSQSKMSMKFIQRQRTNISNFNKTITNQEKSNLNSARNSITSQHGMWFKNQIRNQPDQMSEYKSKNNEEEFSSSGHNEVQVIEDLSEEEQSPERNKSKVLTNSMQRSIASLRRSRQSKVENERVQVISDFQSESVMNQSIMVNDNDLQNINENIQQIENDELERKKLHNDYDLLELKKGTFAEADKLFEIIKTEHKKRNMAAPRSFKEIEKKSIYSEDSLIYLNKRLHDVIMMVYYGIVYFIERDTFKLTQIKPFHILDDVSKVISCDQFKNYVAIKLRDLRKNGYRDHVVFEVQNKELLFDFFIDYAFRNNDDIIFETNEEFSMLVNSAPVWFSFQDLQKCKREQMRMFKNQDKESFQGLVKIKKSSALNFIKGILNQSCWEFKYLVLKRDKLLIYKGQALRKPEEEITLDKNLVVTELRKPDADGNANAFKLTNGKEKNALFISATSSDSFNKWIKALKSLKERLNGKVATASPEKLNIISPRSSIQVDQIKIPEPLTMGRNYQEPQLPQGKTQINENQMIFETLDKSDKNSDLDEENKTEMEKKESNFVSRKSSVQPSRGQFTNKTQAVSRNQIEKKSSMKIKKVMQKVQSGPQIISGLPSSINTNNKTMKDKNSSAAKKIESKGMVGLNKDGPNPFQSALNYRSKQSKVLSNANQQRVQKSIQKLRIASPQSDGNSEYSVN